MQRVPGVIVDEPYRLSDFAHEVHAPMSLLTTTSPSREAVTQRDDAQRRVLWIALTLNALMFFAEVVAGWWFNSTALLADSLDMFADASVYGVSLYAIGRSTTLKAQAAAINAAAHMLLAILMLVEILRCTLYGQLPHSIAMAALSIAALLVNTCCFALLHRFRGDDINFRAVWLCSRNDMLGNIGVMVSAVLVSQLSSAWPDRVIGLVMASIMLYSAWLLWRETRPLLRSSLPFAAGISP